MKIKTFNLFAVVITMTMLAISCGKYEEGPGISLRSKKARLTGEWKVDELKINGVISDFQEDGSNMYFEFEKDGDYEIKFKNKEYSEKSIGQWDFTADKAEVVITLEHGLSYLFVIQKLTKDELWMKHEYKDYVDGNMIDVVEKYKLEKE